MIGLSNDVNNGRHRNIREANKEITERLNHPGLNDDDRAFIIGVISDPNFNPNFAESVEAKDACISKLKQQTLELTREVESKVELLEIRDRTIEELSIQMAEMKDLYRKTKLENSRLQAHVTADTEVITDSELTGA